MDKLSERYRPFVDTVDLRHVREFCLCFSSSTIRHRLVFRNVKAWRIANVVVAAAEYSGFDPVAVAFRAEGCLHMELIGGSVAAVARLWERIGEVPEVVLAEWQTRADFEDRD